MAFFSCPALLMTNLHIQYVTAGPNQVNTKIPINTKINQNYGSQEAKKNKSRGSPWARPAEGCKTQDPAKLEKNARPKLTNKATHTDCQAPILNKNM